MPVGNGLLNDGKHPGEEFFLAGIVFIYVDENIQEGPDQHFLALIFMWYQSGYRSIKYRRVFVVQLRERPRILFLQHAYKLLVFTGVRR